MSLISLSGVSPRLVQRRDSGFQPIQPNLYGTVQKPQVPDVNTPKPDVRQPRPTR